MSELRNLRVVVTRPPDKAAHLKDLLRSEGAIPVSFPTIAIADPESWAEVDAAVARLAESGYEWVVFSSVNAVDKLIERMSPPPDFGGAHIAAVGDITRGALERVGVQVDVVPEQFTGEAMAIAIGRGEGAVLLPRVQDAPPRTAEALRANGWRVDEVVAYRNVRPEDPGPLEEFDAVTLASGSAARNFVELTDIEKWGLTGDGDRVVVCIGPQTAQAAREAGLRVDAVADEHTDEGLVAALRDFVAAR